MTTVRPHKRTWTGGGDDRKPKRVYLKNHKRTKCRYCGERGHIGRDCIQRMFTRLGIANDRATSPSPRTQPEDLTTGQEPTDTLITVDDRDLMVIEDHAGPSNDHDDPMASQAGYEGFLVM